MTSIATDKQIQINVNGQSHELAAGTTVASLLAQLAIPLRGVAVEIEGQIVPRTQHAQRVLAAGERLEIVSLVGGG